MIRCTSPIMHILFVNVTEDQKKALCAAISTASVIVKPHSSSLTRSSKMHAQLVYTLTLHIIFWWCHLIG